jgi:hypothetical protein
MNRSSKALRMAQPLAVVAVWAGLLGYVIPAAFSAAPTVAATATATAASATPHRDARPLNASTGSWDRKAPAVSSKQHHPGPAMVRVMQAAGRPRRVSVTLNHDALSRDQAFASITPYRSVPPGTWIVRAVGAGEHGAVRVTLAAGSRTTLVVLGGHSHLVIRVSGDPHGAGTVAAGSTPSPPTAATPRPAGGSPVPWLVLGGTALLLTLAGVARLRQLRWARRVAAHIP